MLSHRYLPRLARPWPELARSSARTAQPTSLPFAPCSAPAQFCLPLPPFDSFSDGHTPSTAGSDRLMRQSQITRGIDLADQGCTAADTSTHRDPKGTAMCTKHSLLLMQDDPATDCGSASGEITRAESDGLVRTWLVLHAGYGSGATFLMRRQVKNSERCIHAYFVYDLTFPSKRGVHYLAVDSLTGEVCIAD